MRIVKREYLKINLASVLAECKETSEPVLVMSTTKQDNPMVIISKAQYDMMINKINGDK